MKEGWRMVKLGEVCETSAGGTPSKLHKEYYENGNIPWMLSGEVCHKYIYDVEHYITQEGLNNSSAKLFPENTVVVAMYGATAGQVGILKLVTSTNQAVCGILPNDNILPEYLYYYFLYYKDLLVAQAVGNAQPNISQQKIKSVEFPFLSLEEQHRIISILDASFEKIDALKKNAEENLKNAKALFQQVLAQELKPKEGWVEKLGEVCNKIVDGTHHSPTNTPEGEYPYITAKNIKHNGIDLSNITYVTRDIHREIYLRCNPEKGDVLMIKDGATTGIAVVNDLDFEFSLLSSVALLKTKTEILEPYYLCYVLNSPNIYNQFRNKMDGAAITRITLVKIKDAVIWVPPLDQQKNIVATLDTLSEKCHRLEQVAQQTIRECDALKQSILRQAFSGEL